MEDIAQDLVQIIDKELRDYNTFDYAECIEIVIDELKTKLKTMKELGEI